MMTIRKASFFLLVVFSLYACAHEIGNTVIEKPDQYSHIFEAKETVILNAVARVIKEKSIGQNVRIHHEDMSVDSDFVMTGDWRTKATAGVKKLNWKESELVMAVITEKRTKAGWEMRRLLYEEQYDNLFTLIDLRIYEEMAKIE